MGLGLGLDLGLGVGWGLEGVPEAVESVRLDRAEEMVREWFGIRGSGLGLEVSPRLQVRIRYGRSGNG